MNEFKNFGMCRVTVPMRPVVAFLVAMAVGGCVRGPYFPVAPQTYEIDGRKTQDPIEASKIIAEKGDASTEAQTSGAGTPPRLVHTVVPVMPVDAIWRGIVGEVTVELSVEADGRVSRVRILKSPDELLSQAVVEAMEQWVFSPLIQNGVAKAFTVRQKYAFHVAP
jgi:TonB family protein